jgi:hypothetical protein
MAAPQSAHIHGGAELALCLFVRGVARWYVCMALCGTHKAGDEVEQHHAEGEAITSAWIVALHVLGFLSQLGDLLPHQQNMGSSSKPRR